jgi:alcohol oxidase
MGYRELKDLQNLDANNGTERWLRYVGPDGRRQDAAHRFLHPKLQSGHYPNLHVLCESQVIKVLFDGNKRATGVEYRPNPRFQAQARGKQHRTVHAKRLVVLSAGANATPLILERSGLGQSKILQRAGVKLIEELPGVGHDYQDHHLTLYTYRTSLTPQETINAFSDGRFNVQEEIRKNNKQLGWNSMDASGKFRPTEQEVSALGSTFKRVWDRDFRDKPDRPLMIIAMYLR